MSSATMSAPNQAEAPRASASLSPPWVRGPTWDLFFLGGGMGLLSLGVYGLYRLNPSFSGSALVLYSFLFGFPHLAATYYRLYLDRREVRAYRFLAIYTPMILFATLLQLMIFLPDAAVPIFFTVWFHWQWWHILRQQYGIVRIYQRRQRTSQPELDRWIDLAAVYLVPFWGLANRSHQWWAATSTGGKVPFLEGHMWMLPLPESVVWVFAALSAASLAALVIRQVQLYRAGEFSAAKFCMILSGMATFAVAMVLIDDLKWGYLALSLWHALQYIFFVWNYESRRYRAGIDPEARLASWLVQPGRLWAYLLFLCVLAFVLVNVCEWLGNYRDLLPASFALVLTLNLHHYLIDTFIWKKRKAAVAGRA